MTETKSLVNAVTRVWDEKKCAYDLLASGRRKVRGLGSRMTV